jgi:hypothetical protein
MNAELRPMNLGEILDRTTQVYRESLFTLLGIAALPASFLFALHILDIAWLHVGGTGHAPKDAGSAELRGFLVWLGYYHIYVLTHQLALPAFVRMASNTVHGVRSSVWESLRFAARHWRSFLWLAILKLFVQLVVPELLIAAIVLGEFSISVFTGVFRNPDGPTAVLLFAIPTLIAGALFLWLAATLAFAGPVCALERIEGTKAMRRSWEQTRQSRLRILFTWLSIGISGWIGMMGLQLAFRWLVAALWHGLHFGFLPPNLFSAAVQLLFAVAGLFLQPLYPIALTLFYYDQRMRREGYDIERLMEAAGMNSTTLPTVAPSPVAIGEEFQG